MALAGSVTWYNTGKFELEEGVRKTVMRLLPKKSVWIVAALSMLLTGCGEAQASPPPHYKVWSVSQDSWQSRTFVGPQGGIVITMASWCKYCAWEAKWQEPKLLTWGRAHHVDVTLVDISPRGGIGVAGPQNNPNIGKDGSGQYLGTSIQGIKALGHVLQRYSAIYHEPPRQFTIDPTDRTPFAKKTQRLPTIFILNAHGKIVYTFSGITTASRIESQAAAS
ncbi:MAG: hypothetical protein M1493_00640 [Firmicutes bacterium]|jgi:thiol-disulfide isomerase/thioredoxin|nr:hypothetical protein [Bacillota bacterium]